MPWGSDLNRAPELMNNIVSSFSAQPGVVLGNQSLVIWRKEEMKKFGDKEKLEMENDWGKNVSELWKCIGS